MTEWRPRLGNVFAIAMLPTLLAACGPTVTIILLPELDGRQTAVAVKQGNEEMILDQPYAAARQTSSGSMLYHSSETEVATHFGSALSAVPDRAVRFTLYFVQGTTEFTDESKRSVAGILSETARRPVPDILVVGHTDAVGSDSANLVLSQQRADIVRSALVRLGIPPEDIMAVGRGKRAPAVPTPDGVAEPRNSRVEVIVR